jgi:hypothetical protein
MRIFNLCSSPNIIKVTKSRMTKYVEHVARMRWMRNAYKLLVPKPEGRDHLGEEIVDGRIALKWILRQ